MDSVHNYNAEALELHKKYGGKIETISKVPLKDRDDLSRAYSPGVAEVSVEIGRDKHLARQYTLKKNTIAVVSDGSAILGLGNLGAEAAIPVMEGKAAIMKSFADVDAFPICLTTQDAEEIIETIKNIAPVFGGINLEDIASPKCFEIEKRLRDELDIPVMHDDQWGAATVALSALINAIKLAGFTERGEVKIVLSGVGAAGVATAKLLAIAGFTQLVFVDSKGIIHNGRTDLSVEKKELLAITTAQVSAGTLEDALVQADVFIGLSKPNVVTSEMVKTMNKKPIIFALANPSPEIMPEDAFLAGAFIVGTGRSDYPNQINNSLIFPGFWRGVLDAQVEGIYKKVELATFVAIAEKLAEAVIDLSPEKILLDMLDPQAVTIVANAVKNV